MSGASFLGSVFVEFMNAKDGLSGILVSVEDAGAGLTLPTPRTDRTRKLEPMVLGRARIECASRNDYKVQAVLDCPQTLSQVVDKPCKIRRGELGPVHIERPYLEQRKT